MRPSSKSSTAGHVYAPISSTTAQLPPDGLLKYATLIENTRGSSCSGEKVIRLVCVVCARTISDPATQRCPDCKGPVDAIYDLDTVDIPSRRTTPNSLQHYWPLLPLQNKQSLVWLGEGSTPCFELPELATLYGVGKLFVKDESANPSRSTKDRVASVGLSRFSELGIRSIALASTGNSSTAYARGAQLLADFTAHIFVGRDFLNRLNYLDHPNVVTHVVNGDFVDAGQAAKNYAGRTGVFSEGGFFNLSRREGLKTAYLEAFDAMPETPGAVFQAVSSGMGMIGAYKGALEYAALRRIQAVPQMFAVQQQSCAPMASAFARQTEVITAADVIHRPTGIAHAILRGDPTQTYPYLRDVCIGSGGSILAARTTEIKLARRVLSRHALHVCYASATALAGVGEARRLGLIGADTVVLVNLTGADRPHHPVPSRIVVETEQALAAAS